MAKRKLLMTLDEAREAFAVSAFDLATSLACDRNNAAPQDLESGKAPTGTIQTASERVDRVKTDEAPDVSRSAGGTSGSGGATSAAGGGGSGGASGSGR